MTSNHRSDYVLGRHCKKCAHVCLEGWKFCPQCGCEERYGTPFHCYPQPLPEGKTDLPPHVLTERQGHETEAALKVGVRVKYLGVQTEIVAIETRYILPGGTVALASHLQRLLPRREQEAAAQESLPCVIDMVKMTDLDLRDLLGHFEANPSALFAAPLVRCLKELQERRASQTTTAVEPVARPALPVPHEDILYRAVVQFLQDASAAVGRLDAYADAGNWGRCSGEILSLKQYVDALRNAALAHERPEVAESVLQRAADFICRWRDAGPQECDCTMDGGVHTCGWPELSGLAHQMEPYRSTRAAETVR